MQFHEVGLGHFLKYRFWQEACRLMDFQIQQKIEGRNKGYKTLCMSVYEKHGKISPELDNQEYFKSKILNQFFYGLPKEFYVIPYSIPKSNYRHRNYKFLSAPMRTLYYSVCIYILQVAEQFLQECYGNNRCISSYYGGDLRFNDLGYLNVKKSNIVFYNQYEKFRKVLKSETHDVRKKIVIHFDIQNYYDDLSIKTLFKHLETNLKPSIRQLHNFNYYTIEQLISYFSFLSNFKDGIPQCENDICSDFLGWLYLVFSDLAIEDIVKDHVKNIESYKLIRYVDDHYLILKFKETSENEQIRTCKEILSKVSDMLFFKYNLQMNHKTYIYRLEIYDELSRFREGIKKFSKNYEMPIDDNPSFKRKTERILEVVDKIRCNQNIEPLNILNEVDHENLKAVYDMDVYTYFSHSENTHLIEESFQNFDFDLVILEPRTLTILICTNENTKNRYKEYILHKIELTSCDFDLIVRYLCQTAFEDRELISKLQNSNYHYKNILDAFSMNSKIPKDTYFDLPEACFLTLDNSCFIEQVKLRRFNEILENYSLALSHLSNEFCAFVSTFSEQDVWNSNGMQKMLEELAVSNSTKIAVRNLFDRRNNNQVSHAGYLPGEVWGVSKEEYECFKEEVRCSIKEIYNLLQSRSEMVLLMSS